jgi:hypothetical protein
MKMMKTYYGITNDEQITTHLKNAWRSFRKQVDLDLFKVQGRKNFCKDEEVREEKITCL